MESDYGNADAIQGEHPKCDKTSKFERHVAELLARLQYLGQPFQRNSAVEWPKLIISPKS
jgi:hypothetical protein